MVSSHLPSSINNSSTGFFFLISNKRTTPPSSPVAITNSLQESIQYGDSLIHPVRVFKQKLKLLTYSNDSVMDKTAFPVSTSDTSSCLSFPIVKSLLPVLEKLTPLIESS